MAYSMMDTYEIVEPNTIPHVHLKFAEILKVYQPGDKITVRSILDARHTEFAGVTDDHMVRCVRNALKRAVAVGLAKKIEYVEHDITHLDTVQYWLGYLNGGKYNHAKPKSTTRSAYLVMLTQFDQWLQGKTHQIERYNHATDTQEITHQQFDNVEELLHFTKKPSTDPSNTVRIITRYLQDPVHKHKKAASLVVTKAAVKSYFAHHDRDLNIKYNPKVNHSTLVAEKSFTLSDLLAMLTHGNPTVLDKALFLCMFQRGMDISTTIDRFNYDAWEQIAKHFGGENYEMWDLSRCPVPISLVRVKTDYKHSGYIDRDAVSALIPYLKHRYKVTGKPMSADQPLFITNKCVPIKHYWVHNRFIKLGNKAEIIRTKIYGGKNRAGPHEMRDLLKSTLIVAGCRADVAEHVIGHKPKDSYEKQHVLYPEAMREEFAKASYMINIFTRFASLTNKGDDIQKIKVEMTNKLVDFDHLTQEVQRLRKLEETRNESAYDLVRSEIEELKSEIVKLKSSNQTKSSLEFCCVSCELIHDRRVCPSCGSSLRRIFHS